MKIYYIFCEKCGKTLYIKAKTLKEAEEQSEEVNCCGDYLNKKKKKGDNKMNKNLIKNVLEDYLEALYRCGTEEEQDRVSKAIKELDGRIGIEQCRIVEVDINNANHPSRQKAIQIMNYIELHFGEELFDCKDGDSTWYDVEDSLTNIIEGKEIK